MREGFRVARNTQKLWSYALWTRDLSNPVMSPSFFALPPTYNWSVHMCKVSGLGIKWHHTTPACSSTNIAKLARFPELRRFGRD